MANIITDHPYISAGVGIGGLAVIGLVAWAISAAVRSKKPTKIEKTPEMILVEAREKRLNWSESKETELSKDSAFQKYLGVCVEIQRKSNELMSLRIEQERLHDREMELSSKATELYSRCVEFGAHSKLFNELDGEWRRVNRELEVVRIKLNSIYQRLRELPEQIEKLEEQKAKLQQEYKGQLGKFEKVKSKDAKKKK